MFDFELLTTWLSENSVEIVLAILILWIKHDLGQKNRVEEKKYALKYDACIDALHVIDAQFSHLRWYRKSEGDMPIDPIQKQWLSVEFVRRCHSALQITCSVDVVDQFNNIMFGNGDGALPNTNDLHEFRVLVKKELGFGGRVPTDLKRTWFAGSKDFIYEIDPR